MFLMCCFVLIYHLNFTANSFAIFVIMYFTRLNLFLFCSVFQSAIHTQMISSNISKRLFSLPESGNIWDHFVQNLKCNATYPVDKPGVIMFELEVEDGTSDRIPCQWNFLGSKRNQCTVALVCPKTVHFNAHPEPDPEKCVENYLTLLDGTRGKLTGCNKFTFQDKPRVPRNGGTDLYVEFKGKTEARNCMVFCIEDLNANVTGLNRTTKISSNKEWKGFKLEEGCVCGRKNQESLQGKIIGGDDATKHEFPWLVSLTLKNSEVLNNILLGPNHWICAGSLINDRWILTAAHCLFWLDGREIQVVMHHHVMDRAFPIGEDPNDAKFQEIPGWNLPNETDQSENRIRVDVETIISHPLFDQTSFDYDVALIKLKTPLDFKTEKRVSPICLPQVAESFSFPNRAKMTIAGWGVTDNNGYSYGSRIPQKLDIEYFSREECIKYVQPTSRHICAGVLEAGKGACYGDSGGPLIYNFDGTKYLQAGIVSSGDPSGCAQKDKLTFYTDVQEVIQWIYKYTADGTWCSRK